MLVILYRSTDPRAIWAVYDLNSYGDIGSKFQNLRGTYVQIFPGFVHLFGCFEHPLWTKMGQNFIYLMEQNWHENKLLDIKIANFLNRIESKPEVHQKATRKLIAR